MRWAPPLRIDDTPGVGLAFLGTDPLPYKSENSVSDQIIDIKKYLSRSHHKGGGFFSVWGGEGDRARFALPIWRAVFLVGGDRGGIVHLPADGNGPATTHFVLDLGQDPARKEFIPPPTSIIQAFDAPSTARLPGGGVAIYLGEERERRWFLMVTGGEGEGPLSGRRREDILFLAGECAGLLFFRDLAEGAEMEETE